MYNNILEDAGLTKTEAQVYNAFLILKQATPSEIAKESGISRENAYHFVDRLLPYGLISQVQHAKKKTFRVEDPYKLLNLFRKQEQAIQDTILMLEQVVARIDSELTIDQNKPLIKLFKGIEGVKHGYMKTLEEPTKEPHYGFLSRSWPSEFTEWVDDVFVPERVKKDTHLNLILTKVNDVTFNEYLELSKTTKRDVIHVDSDEFPTGSYLVASKDKFLITINKGGQKSIEDDIAIIIEHEPITTMMRALFKIIWE
jgi:sugar-specific transcriptional regulator TrmB